MRNFQGRAKWTKPRSLSSLDATEISSSGVGGGGQGYAIGEVK